MEVISQWAHLGLEWIGFGTVVGLLAKAIMPGRDPGGAIVTLLMGIGGTVIGAGTLTFFWPAQSITPLSPLGFAVATAGAFLLLLFYRLLAGHFFVEGEHGEFMYRRRPYTARRRRRSTARVVYED